MESMFFLVLFSFFTSGDLVAARTYPDSSQMTSSAEDDPQTHNIPIIENAIQNISFGEDENGQHYAMIEITVTNIVNVMICKDEYVEEADVISVDFNNVGYEVIEVLIPASIDTTGVMAYWFLLFTNRGGEVFSETWSFDVDSGLFRINE